MTISGHILSYAEPASGARRPWCRTAVKALAWVVASPLLVTVPLLYAAQHNWLPQHFLCCNHPEIAALAFVAVPGAGAVLGTKAAADIWRDTRRPRPRGMVTACFAVVAGVLLAVLGVGLVFLLKA